MAAEIELTAKHITAKVELEKVAPDESALQRDSVWQVKGSVGNDASPYLRFHIDSSRGDVKERTKLVDDLQSALSDQKFYGIADLATPAIVVGAAFASKYKPVLAVCAGAGAALGYKIYNVEKIADAQARADQAIGKMAPADALRFGKFATEMNASTNFSRDAYLPFSVYTLASFVPVAKNFTSPAGIVFFGAAGAAADSYQSLVSRPMIDSKFQAEKAAWKKELK